MSEQPDEQTSGTAQQVGRALGRGFSKVKSAVQNYRVKDDVKEVADIASDEYKKSTGRKLGKDATIAAAVGGGLVAVSAVGSVIGLAATAAVVGAGALGTAVVARKAGYDKEVDNVEGQLQKGYSKARSFAKDVASGFKETSSSDMPRTSSKIDEPVVLAPTRPVQPPPDYPPVK